MSERSPIDWATIPFKKYAVFSGRAPRAEYWWFYLATTVVSLLLTGIESALGDIEYLSAIFGLATIVPWLAVAVRRLHDIDRTGWWVGGMFVPLVIFGAVVGAGAVNEAALSSFTAPLIIAMLALIVGAITLFIFSVLPGTEGDNRYGPDPYGPDNLEQVFA